MLSLALLKAFNKEVAIGWVEERKEKLSQMLPYKEEVIEEARRVYGDFYAQSLVDGAPKNMYVLCLDRIVTVDDVIRENGLLYINFEQARQLYSEKGILSGSSEEIKEFNSLMEFVYLGRKEVNNSNLENLDSYVVTK